MVHFQSTLLQVMAIEVGSMKDEEILAEMEM
jgi:hypothetical protein